MHISVTGSIVLVRTMQSSLSWTHTLTSPGSILLVIVSVGNSLPFVMSITRAVST